MKTRKWLFWAAMAGIALLVLFIPFAKRVETINLAAIYPGTLTNMSMVRASEQSVVFDYRGLRLNVQARPWLDAAKIDGEPKPRGFDDMVATIMLGEACLVTRHKEDPGNLARGVKIGYPCELVFRRNNCIVRVEFEKLPDRYGWADNVNRLTDQEQIAVLSEVAAIVDHAIATKHPGVTTRKLTPIGWVSVKAFSLWDKFMLWIVGGGRHHS